jgi:hypothetical protein
MLLFIANCAKYTKELGLSEGWVNPNKRNAADLVDHFWYILAAMRGAHKRN